MIFDVQLAKLESEIADIDEKLQTLDRQPHLSKGEVVLQKRHLGHLRRKTQLAIEILRQQQTIEPLEKEVAERKRHYEWAQTENGRKILARKEMQRDASSALGGGSHSFTRRRELADPEERAVDKARDRLRNSEEVLRNAKTKLLQDTDALEKLKTQDVEWEALGPDNWQDIDHRLAGLKLTNLAEEMHQQMDAEERRIRFENQHNLNRGASSSLVLQMKEQLADEWISKAYDIYCEVWRIQGRTKSAGFVRAVFAQGIVPMLNARAGAIAHEFALHARRTGSLTPLTQATLTGLSLRMQRLKDRWQRQLEIEARECQHSQGSKPLQAAVLSVSSIAGEAANSSSPEQVAKLAGEMARETRDDTPNADSISQREALEPGVGVASATWDAIEILFLSDERVRIVTGANCETRNYAEFGFADSRNGKPNQAWVTLRGLAEQGGTIRDAAKAGRTWPKIEKRIQEIRKVLRKHFRNSTDPIPFVEGTGYKARFKISCGPSFDT